MERVNSQASANSALESGPGELSTQDVGVLSMATTQVLTSRFTMAYAAGINETNAAFYDDTRQGGLHIHPGIAFSMQWASRFRPDQPVNVRAAPFGVHASTDLHLYRPFRPGEAITTQGQVVAKRQVEPGVYAADRYRMVSSTGELVAELYYNGITRGATLAGAEASVDSEPPWPELKRPELKRPKTSGATTTPLWACTIPIGLHAGQQYTECAQIYNPIHTEPSVAKAAGLPGVILHGSATKAMSLSAIVNEYFAEDMTCITRLCGQLRGMVLLDSSIRVEVWAVETHDGERRVAFRTLTAEGQPAISHGVVCGRLA